MHKQELLHLHRLLHAVRCSLETEEWVPEDAFVAYDDLCTGPYACNQNKREHKVAISRLLTCIETAIEARPEEEATGELLVS